MLSFQVSPEDHAKLNSLAKRAVKMAVEFEVPYGKQDALMDLTAWHANGMPLDLDKFLAADDANFGHDVFGIRRHIDRKTGKIEGFFVPRCAAQQ